MIGPAVRWLSYSVLLAAMYSCGSGSSSKAADAQAAAVDSTRTDSTSADSTRRDSVAADSTANDSARALMSAVPVETTDARLGSISSYLVFNSTVETEAAVEIYPQTTGLVKEVLVEEGDRVAAGDILVRIDADALSLAAEEARINLQHLQRNFGRTQEMFSRNLISHQEFENKQYELEQARLRSEQAELNLQHATIRAPFSGVITERLVQVGARVGNGTKLMSMIKLDDMIVRVYVPGQHLTDVRVGQPAVITSDFLKGREFAGWVKRISPVVDPRSGTFKVTVGLRDRWEYLRPGIFANVRIITDTHPRAVLVPKQAVVYDGGERFIFVVRDSIAERIRLEAGYENDSLVEALRGVDVGDPIIVVGQNGLKAQARVKLVQRPAAADSARTQG